MTTLLLWVALLGGCYGFALYCRDVYRAARRARHGLSARIWPPEIVIVEQDDNDEDATPPTWDNPAGFTPKRPDR